MSRILRAVLSASSLLLAIVATASAQPCIDSIAVVVQPGDWIRVILNDSSKVEGALASIDSVPGQPRVTVRFRNSHKQGEPHLALFERQPQRDSVIAAADIAVLRYRRETTRTDNIRMGAAVLSGFMIGFATGHEDRWSAYRTESNRWEHGLIGGAIGVGASLLLSLVHNPTTVVPCR